MRVNLACGDRRRDGWVNVDGDPTVPADIHLPPAEFLRRHGADAEAVHVTGIDRMALDDAAALLSLAANRLPDGAPVSVSYTDCRAAFSAYLAGQLDNATLNGGAAAAARPRIWWHDADSACALLDGAGLDGVTSGAPGDDGCAEATARVPASRRPLPAYLQPVPPARRPPQEPAPADAEAAILERLRLVTAELEQARTAEAVALQRTQQLESVEGSPSYRVAVRLSRLAGRALPDGTRRRLVTARVMRAALRRAQSGSRAPRL